MQRTSILLVGVLIPLTAACDVGQTELAGQWQPVEPEGMAVRFEADSTFVLNTGNFEGGGSYTVDEAGQLTMTPTGRLAAVIPAGFTGLLNRDTLNLCGPGGTCAKLVKGE